VFLPRSLLIVAVIFSFATLGALVLVVVDLAVGRPVAGDLFIAGLNGAAAVVFWKWWAQGGSRRAE
jgi:hypothetical protein